MQIDVAILGGCDDEAVTLDIFMFDNLNCIDQCFVCDDEDFFDEEAVGFLVVEVDVFDAPDFHLAGGVASDEGVVVFCYCYCC